jgi:hypothetical protein
MRKETPAASVQVARALAAMQAERDEAAALAGKHWKKSEYDVLLQRLVDANDLDAIQALRTVVEAAMQSGRWTDDCAPTRANVAARLPPGAWRITAAEVPLLMKYVATLDKPGSSKYGDAAMKLLDRIVATGGYIEEHDLGHAYKDALPRWVDPSRARACWQDGQPATKDDQYMATAQAQRWTAMEHSWRTALDAIADGRDLPPMPAAGGWQPFEDVSSYNKGCLPYGQANRACLAEKATADRAEARRVMKAATDAAMRETAAGGLPEGVRSALADLRERD